MYTKEDAPIEMDANQGAGNETMVGYPEIYLP